MAYVVLREESGGQPLSAPRGLEERSSVIVEVRDAVQVADDTGDPGSIDLFLRLFRMHEKQLWFLSEILKSDDAHVS